MVRYKFNPDILPSTKGVYIVGGSVRDLLLETSPVDFDLVVCNADAEAYARQMAARAAGHHVCMGKNDKQIHRVVTHNMIFDISSAKGPTIEADLGERDFTINAMALCLETHRLIDITGGQKDLANKVIRSVSDTVFKNDPIRLLRAFRIAADLGFSIDPATLALIQKHSGEITISAPERIREEWFKLLSAPNTSAYLVEMVLSGLLFAVFPEIQPLTDCEQNNHHAYNVLDHTLAAYQRLEAVFNDPSKHLEGDLVSEMGRWETKRKALLKQAILVHDIGKPASRSVHADGSIHFYKHAALGADITAKINQRLRFSNEEDHYLVTVVKNHTRPLNLSILHQNQKFNPRLAVRFFNQSGPWAPDILVHSLADHWGKGPQVLPDFIEFVFMLSQDYFNCFKPKKSAPRILTGHDLMTVFGLHPSPVFKDLLDRVEELRLAGEVETKEQAMEMVKRWLADMNPKKSG